MYGPSRWKPGTAARTAASSSAARRSVVRPWASASWELVTSVGKSPATPWRRHSATTRPTSSVVNDGELKLTPPQPLICRSNSAGAAQPTRRSGRVPPGSGTGGPR